MKPSPPELEPQISERRNPGCLRAALAAPVLVALAPFVAVSRWWAARRRGQRLLVRWSAREAGAGAERLRESVLEVDVPRSREAKVKIQLTEMLVRVAEALATPGHVNHLIYREPTEPEPVVLPLGPGIQTLAERLSVTLGRSSLHGRTVLWLVLPREVPVGEALDPRSYDPDAADEPRGAICAGEASYGVALRFRRSGPATLFRVAIWAPGSATDKVETFVQRFTARASSESGTGGTTVRG